MKPKALRRVIDIVISHIMPPILSVVSDVTFAGSFLVIIFQGQCKLSKEVEILHSLLKVNFNIMQF